MRTTTTSPFDSSPTAVKTSSGLVVCAWTSARSRDVDLGREHLGRDVSSPLLDNGG